MSTFVTIAQMPVASGESLFGLEKYGRSKFPKCNSEMEIPIANGKHKLGMTKEQEDTYAQYFVGSDSSSSEWKEWLNSFTFKAPYEEKTLDLSLMEDSFVYHVFIKGNPDLCFIAPSRKFAEDHPLSNYKYFVANEQQDAEEEVSTQKLKNKARAKLVEIQDDEIELIKIAHYLFNVRGITNSTSAYKTINNSIDESKESASRFIRVFDESSDFIDVTVTVKRAIEKNIIRRGQDNWYYNHASNTRLGRNQEEIIEFLMNPKNQDELGTGSKNDSPLTIKKQLKDKEI